MSDVYHAIVWVDHSEAKIFRFGGDDVPEIVVRSHTSLQRLHHRKTGWEAGGITPDDTEFFRRILDALGDTGGTVITGPGNAKTALKAYLEHVRPESTWRVFAMETTDQPNAQTLLALGRRYFKAPLQMQSPERTDEKSTIPH
jgi:stalled ribosome rescue protein Dom34